MRRASSGSAISAESEGLGVGLDTGPGVTARPSAVPVFKGSRINQTTTAAVTAAATTPTSVPVRKDRLPPEPHQVFGRMAERRRCPGALLPERPGRISLIHVDVVDSEAGRVGGAEDEIPETVHGEFAP